MTRISCRVQAHPSREHLWPDLLDSLEPIPTQISVHSSTPPNPWAGYQQALRSLLDDVSQPTHGLIIQEDTVVCGNFPLAVERIADRWPDIPVLLYLSWLPRRAAVLANKCAPSQRYLELQLRPNEFMPIVAVLWPLSKAAEFLSWTENNHRRLGHPQPRSDDGVAGRWCGYTKQRIVATLPSLVEHEDRVASIWGRRASWGRDKGRTALRFIGDRDPLELDWS